MTILSNEEQDALIAGTEFAKDWGLPVEDETYKQYLAAVNQEKECKDGDEAKSYR